MTIDFQAGQRFNETCQENLDPYGLPRIERDERQIRRDGGLDHRGRKLSHAPGPTQQMRDTAATLGLWQAVAAAIENARGTLTTLADTTFTGSVLHRDCLRTAAAALEPHVKLAMSIRQGLSDEYTKQFDQHEMAKQCAQ